jgi:Holliday junction resolvase-like predicted endonuclease
MTWNGEALDRLLDADHAALVDIVAATLRTLEWLVAVEVSFNIRGEWGSIDVLAFHPATGVILVVEVKSVVPDLQATIFTLDRKRGWVWRLRPSADGWSIGGSAPRCRRRRTCSDGLPNQAIFAAAFQPGRRR